MVPPSKTAGRPMLVLSLVSVRIEDHSGNGMRTATETEKAMTV